LKAHTVTKVEETDRFMIVHIERLGRRLLRCGVCRQRCRQGAQCAQPAGMARSVDAEIALETALPPASGRMPQVWSVGEDFHWADPWARVTTALSNAVARLARELSWQGTARQYGLNWKSVATIVKRAVAYGLAHRVRPPVHVIGIDEVSRRKGQVYLTVIYDLERRVQLWVGDDRTEEAVKPFFTKKPYFAQSVLPNTSEGCRRRLPHECRSSASR
jgi:transposase